MDEHLILLLVRAGAVARRLVTLNKDELSLTPLELDVMRRIAADAVLVPSNWARALGISRQHLHSTLLSMERRGLIERVGPKAFRIGEWAGPVLETGEALLAKALQGVRNVMSWEEQDQLRALLLRLMQAPERHDAHRWPTIFTRL